MAIFNTVYGGEWRFLPKTYQEVEYIQTTGTQYINIWMKAENYHQTETKIELTTTSQDIPVFWWTDGSSVRYHLTPFNNKWYFWIAGSEWNGGTYTATIGKQYAIVYNNSNNYLNVDWSDVVSVSGTTGYSGSQLCISYRSSGWVGMKYWQFKYFYFKVKNKNTGEYEREFVPCYRKSDSVIWMYDLVWKQFYTNAGSWTFTKWPDVN